MCCRECCKQIETKIKPSRVKLPKHAIANGMIFGEAPPELQELNDVELALVSQARIDKHVFTFYGGCHKSMRGWHNLYENNVQHNAGIMQRLQSFGVETTIACILQGPFTEYQRKQALFKTRVDPDKVLRAMTWLKENNRLYSTFTIPDASELPKPVIINESELVQSENTSIESQFEYTVVFPETEDVTTTNGGHMTQEEFKTKVIDSIDMSNQLTMVSKPTRTQLKDYEGNTLLMAFPLQFPYGYGAAPVSTVTNKTSAGARIEYIRFIQELSIANMHRPDFVLVLHNMYERHQALNRSYLKCINRVGNKSAAEAFSDISVRGLQVAIASRNVNMTVRDPVTRQFLNSIDAVCKSMGHTNNAAKAARLHMFANNVRFGQAAVFATTTPQDDNSFRLKIYVQHRSGEPPTVAASDDLIEADIELSIRMRQEYPGLCAFEFQEVTDLLIEHVFGWDCKSKQSKPNGGIFGKLDAWSAAAEEQGRKTLHNHWILWVKDWSKMLAGLHAADPLTRQHAKEDLEQYVNSVLSNDLFGTSKPSRESIAIEKAAYAHECKEEEQNVIPELCSDQSLRNLRFKHGKSEYGDNNIVCCSECGHKFSAEELVENVMKTWYGSETNLKNKMTLAVKRYSAQLDTVKTAKERAHRDFMVAALRNLHSSDHVTSCFKKGCECRFEQPVRSCDSIQTHYDEGIEMEWWSWTGTKSVRHPFMVESRRHIFDVFVNTYNRVISNLLGCNTNVQCGIDGGHIMYVTYYSSKGTQAEDQKAYVNVAAALYKRLKKQEEEEQDPDSSSQASAPTPFSEGYRRLLSAVFSHTKAHVTSAPMAWYIMRNGSRFRFSHQCTYLPLDAFMGRASSCRVGQVGDSLYIVDKMAEYIYRPVVLHEVCLYDFIMHYDIVNISKKKQPKELMYFQSGYGRKDDYAVVELDIPRTPLVSFLDFPTSADFDGDILNRQAKVNGSMEKFAKAAYTLFVPFDDPQLHEPQSSTCFLQLFRDEHASGCISEQVLQRLQNIQNCRNMLKAGRQPDMLGRSTVEIPKPNGAKGKDDTDTEEAINEHIEKRMTELLSEMDANNDLECLGPEETYSPSLSMMDLRQSTKISLHSYGIVEPCVERRSCVYEFKRRTPRDGDNQSTSRAPTGGLAVTKKRLSHLVVQSYKRNVTNIKKLSHVNCNGTVESIQEWANLSFFDQEKSQLDESQTRAFEIIMSQFVLTYFTEAQKEEDVKNARGIHEFDRLCPNNRVEYKRSLKKLRKLHGMRKQEQMIMFLTGQGGSGKTRVIDAVLAYAKQFCRNLNVVFNKRTIVVTALTGVAATLINGETLHSAAKFGCKEIKMDDIDEWRGTRMMIIDECSFATEANLCDLNHNLNRLKQTLRQKYGNLHIVFAGDFSQLEPVSGNPLYYSSSFALWHDYINVFIELTGQHRFKDDPKYGAIMTRFQQGNPTERDFEIINSRVVSQYHEHLPSTEDVPTDVAYAVFQNSDRSAINNAVFWNHVKKTHSQTECAKAPKHTLMIRSDDLTWSTNGKPFGLQARTTLWTECGDSSVTTTGDRPKFVDTCLKVYSRMPMMHTENSDVENGEANGTLGYLHKVHFKDGVTEDDFELMRVDGYWIRSIAASNVDYIELEHTGSHRTNRTFKVYADKVTCKISMPLSLIPGERIRRTVRARVNRFPLLANHATTGHKLQGQSKNSICIFIFNYGKNWPYVVLSRVRTLKGLFLREPLDPARDFSNDKRLKQMLLRFRLNKTPDDFEHHDSMQRRIRKLKLRFAR